MDVSGSTPIVIVGAGGFGREVLDIVEAVNRDREGGEDYDFLGFVDDGSPDLRLLGDREAPFLGGTDCLSRFAGASFVLGVGSPNARRDLDQVAVDAGLRPVRLVHPSATMGAMVTLGEGMIVCAHVSITTNIVFGRHVHLNLSSTVGHDCVIGDYVTVNPGANISGNVTLQDGVTVGTGAAIIQGRAVGAGTMIGAGALVTKDLPGGVTAVGAPARALRVGK